MLAPLPYTERLLALSRLATAGLSFRERMEAISPGLVELTRATSLSVGVVHLGGARGPEPAGELVHVHGLEAGPYLRYLREHILEDPLHPHALRADGRPVLLGDHLAPGDFGRTDFTRFLRDLGIRHLVGCALRLPDGSTLLVAGHRAARRRDFGASERMALQLISVDLARAVAITILSGMLGAATGSETPFAAVALDRVGRAAGSVGPLGERAFAELGSEARGLLLAAAREALARPGRAGESGPLAPPGGPLARLVYADPRSGLGGLLVLCRSTGRPKDSASARLTPRQREVVTLLLSRLTNAEIAAELGLQVDAVKYHAKRIYQILGVHDRRGLLEACPELT